MTTTWQHFGSLATRWGRRFFLLGGSAFVADHRLTPDQARALAHNLLAWADQTN